MSVPPAAAPVMKAGAVVKRKKPAMLQATAAQMQSFVVCVSQSACHRALNRVASLTHSHYHSTASCRARIVL
jgi:hypothetical protein